MLDLGGKATPTKAVEITKASPVKPKVVSTNPYALQMDMWNARRGENLIEDSPRIRSLGLSKEAIADFHCAAFDPEPMLNEDCKDAARHEFLRQLLDTSEYQSLHCSTALSEIASEIAATAFAEQFANLEKKREDRKKEEGCKVGIGKKRKPVDDEMEELVAVGAACKEAAEEVGELEDCVEAMGMGEGKAGTICSATIAQMFQRVRGNPTLKKICELAGKFRHHAQSKQRKKTVHGMDDIVGVEIGGDLGKALPYELAKLAIPEFELDTLRRIVERQLLQRQYQSLEPVAKGPIILAIDESGSMEGNKVCTAKAIGLALAWIARQQNRWCGLIAYSGSCHDGPNQRLLSLPPNHWDEEKLMDWLCAFIGDGSSIDVPVREMPRMYKELKAPVGETDVIFITDAECHIPDDMQTTFNEWKKEVKARLITLVIGCEDGGSLANISDELHCVGTLSLDEKGVDRILSI